MANTIDVSKVSLHVVTAPTPLIRSSKVSLHVIVGPSSGPEDPLARMTQMPVGIVAAAEDPDASGARMTQLPLGIVTAADNPDVSTMRLTQMPVLILALPIKASMMTQMSMQTVMPLDPTDVLPMIPQWPIVERWSWYTTLVSSYRGYEQRMAVRVDPEVKVDYSVPLTSDEQRRQAFYTLYRYSATVMEYPLFQYLVNPTEAAELGDTDLYVDHRLTNLRVGEAAYLFSPDGTQWMRVEIESITASPPMITLRDPLPEAIDVDWFIVPTPRMRIADGQDAGLDAGGNGVMNLGMSVEEPRTLLRPEQETTSLLMMFGDDIVLPDAWMSPSVTVERFSRGREDLEAVSNRQFFEGYLHTQRSTSIRFFLQKEDLDYWRAFAAAINGRRGTFLAPSLREDVILASEPLLGATILYVENNEVALYMASASNRWLRFERTNGSVIYRMVLECILGTDRLVRIKLNQSIGGAAGDNQFAMISLMSRYRLDSDEITVEHNVNHIELAFSMRTVEE